jgi:hypothetical protein
LLLVKNRLSTAREETREALGEGAEENLGDEAAAA